MVLLILAIIVLDIGTQFGQVANQTRVQNLGEKPAIVTIPSLCFLFHRRFTGFIDWYINVAKLWLVWCYFNWYWVPIVRIIFHFMLFAPKNEAKT